METKTIAILDLNQQNDMIAINSERFELINRIYYY